MLRDAQLWPGKTVVALAASQRPVLTRVVPGRAELQGRNVEGQMDLGTRKRYIDNSDREVRGN